MWTKIFKNIFNAFFAVKTIYFEVEKINSDRLTQVIWRYNENGIIYLVRRWSCGENIKTKEILYSITLYANTQKKLLSSKYSFSICTTKGTLMQV